MANAGIELGQHSAKTVNMLGLQVIIFIIFCQHFKAIGEVVSAVAIFGFSQALVSCVICVFVASSVLGHVVEQVVFQRRRINGIYSTGFIKSKCTRSVTCQLIIVITVGKSRASKLGDIAVVVVLIISQDDALVLEFSQTIVNVVIVLHRFGGVNVGISNLFEIPHLVEVARPRAGESINIR